MKATMTVIAWALFCLTSFGADEIAGPDTASGKKFTDFIRYATWPDEKEIEEKRIDVKSVAADVEEMRNVIARRIRAEYLPKSSDFNMSLTACTNLYDSGDHLLLRYSTTNRVLMKIQEGVGLYLLIDNPNAEKVPLPRSAELIKMAAAEYLLLPGNAKLSTEKVDVFVSSTNIGYSRCGTLRYGPNSFPPEHWYSSVKWWTDGRRVLFALPRKDTAGWVRSQPQAPGASVARRFEGRTASEKSE